MPSTACYCVANRGDNTCKAVTDSLIPVSGLLEFLVRFCCCSNLSLHYPGEKKMQLI